MSEIDCNQPFSALLDEFPLMPSRVHVLHASLERSPEELARFHDTLTGGERERAARFRFEIHRRRFIAARGLLRQTLGIYLDISPGDVRFAYGPKGKPYVGGDLQFNASDSGDIAMLAFALEMPLGIDVEQIRALHDLEGLAHRFFSPAEWTAIDLLPFEERVDAFFRTWTRKEAFVKATGDGLSYGLDQFDVAPTGRARMLDIKNSAAEASHWSMRDIALPPGYIGALAFRGAGFEIRGAHVE